MSLFTSRTRRNNDELIKFRAGKLNLENGLVTPDVRKGFLTVVRAAGKRVNVTWKERNKQEDEDTHSFFTGDSRLVKIDKCASGRVYGLVHVNSKSKPTKFFWMQGPSESRDAEIVGKVNDFLKGKHLLYGSVSTGTLLENASLGISGDDFLTSFANGNFSALGNLLNQARAASMLENNPRNGGLGILGELLQRRNESAADEPSFDPTPPQTPMVTSEDEREQVEPAEDYISNEYVKNAFEPLLENDEFYATVLSQDMSDSGSDTSKILMFCNVFKNGGLTDLMRNYGFGSDVLAAAEKGSLNELVKALEDEAKSRGESHSVFHKQEEDHENLD